MKFSYPRLLIHVLINLWEYPWKNFLRFSWFLQHALLAQWTRRCFRIWKWIIDPVATCTLVNTPHPINQELFKNLNEKELKIMWIISTSEIVNPFLNKLNANILAFMSQFFLYLEAKFFCFWGWGYIRVK